MALNREYGLGFIGEEFTAGLIHDLGRSLFGVISPAEFSAADPLDFEESAEILRREREILRSDHCELGAWFIANNKLPEPLIDVVLLHHTPHLALVNRKLVAVTAVADHMANYLQRNGSADEYNPQENTAIEILFDESSGNRTNLAKKAHALMTNAMREACSANGPFGAA
jgi:HD-like signal output (HDOD) protein